MNIDVTVSDALRDHAVYRPLVERATRAIEMRVGNYSSAIHAEWSLISGEGGGDSIRLTLRAWTGEVETTFQPDDLQSRERVNTKLYFLWNDLLGIRIRHQLDELKLMSDEGVLA